MAERPAESSWLYNKPFPGVVTKWWGKEETQNQLRREWGTSNRILGTGFILNTPFDSWEGPVKPNDRYTEGQVIMVKNTYLVIPSPGTELHDIWQAYTDSDEGRNDFNGSKFGLRRYTRPLSDTNLTLEVFQNDWHRMRTLGMGLRDGKIDPHYRDGILPTRTTDGYVFLSDHPNNMVVQAAIITADNHLILTQKPIDADYYPGAISASIEEQMHGQRDNSPFATLDRAIGKVKGPTQASGEELKLGIIPGSSRLAAMVVEMDCNALGLIMVTRVEETSDQIDYTKFGSDRDEFDSAYSVQTLPLDKPESLVHTFHQPNFNWHGLSLIRIVAALSYVHGYEEALNLLYRSKPF